MSIATLKRKTKLGGNPREDPISGVGKLGFSLNGTLRNHGGVGCFRMVSNVTRTPFRGTLPMGNGGCCGNYYDVPLNSGNCCTNDSSIVKKSVKNTDGMLMEKYKGILFGTYPNTWVKDDNNANRITGTQGQYLEGLTWKFGSCNFNPALKESTDDVCKCPQGRYIYIGSKKKIFYKPTTKSVSSFTPYGTNISQGLYITAGGVAKKNHLPTPPCLQHFPMMLSHNGCDVNYYTWQQAQSAGLLPSDYLNCPCPLDIPSNFRVSINSSGTATLLWNAPPGNVSNYTITYSSNGGSNGSKIVTDTSSVISSLTIGYIYTFLINANNVVGSSDSSSITLSTIPNPPTNVNISVNSPGTISLSWTKPIGNVDITNYTITYSSSGGSNGSISVIDTFKTLTPLLVGYNYNISIKANNNVGSSISNTTSIYLI